MVEQGAQGWHGKNGAVRSGARFWLAPCKAHLHAEDAGARAVGRRLLNDVNVRADGEVVLGEGKGHLPCGREGEEEGGESVRPSGKGQGGKRKSKT